MKTFALVNPASGSISADGPSQMREALANLGLSHAEVVPADCTRVTEQMIDIAKQDPDLFIVWGGDGTLRTALGLVGKKTPNLLLLPGGTMNLLTKSIHGDKTWGDILKEVATSRKHVILPAGQLRDETFYCAMLAGAPARFAEARESLRRGELVNVLAGARAALDTLSNMHLNARYGEGYRFADERLPPTSVIGALVGPLVKEHKMEVAALSDPSAVGVLNVVWASFLSDWRSAPGIKLAPAETLVIESEEGDD